MENEATCSDLLDIKTASLPWLIFIDFDTAAGEATKFQAVWLTMLIQWELSNRNCNIDFYAKWQMRGLEFR